MALARFFFTSTTTAALILLDCYKEKKNRTHHFEQTGKELFTKDTYRDQKWDMITYVT